MKGTVPKDINEYIAGFSEPVQQLLQEIRAAIQKAAPDAQEAISYQMPTFKLNGNLVHFAAYKNHIGFYPAPTGITQFETELSDYQTTKGAIRFALDQPLPLELVSRIVKYRVKAHTSKVSPKNRK